MLSKESIEEFKKIYKEKFGKELTDQEVFERAINLLNFYKIVYKADQETKK